MTGYPFRQGERYTIGHLRSVAERIIADRQSDPILSAALRTQRRKDIPWAKSWNEEFSALKLFADHKGLSDDVIFWWTPERASDFTVRIGRTSMALQSTMAYPEWSVVTGQAGHVRYREMEKINADGHSFCGGLVSMPRARGPEEDLRAWRSGIESALTRKLNAAYAGCRLLIFAPGCRFNTIDFDFVEVIRPAVEAVGSAVWGQVLEAIYVLDEPKGAFVKFPPCADKVIE
jgi:hypothetical protein